MLDLSSSNDDISGAVRFQKKEIKNKIAKRIQVRGQGIQAVLAFLKEKSKDPVYSALNLFYFIGSFETGLGIKTLSSIVPDYFS